METTFTQTVAFEPDPQWTVTITAPMDELCCLACQEESGRSVTASEAEAFLAAHSAKCTCEDPGCRCTLRQSFDETP